ncbi:MAG: hypothetical protein ABIM89_04995 [Mycobacteriales bacterium]
MTTSPTVVPSPISALEEFQSRSPLPSCGTLEWGHQPAPTNDVALECFNTAMRTGTGAELMTRHPTVEGDEIHEYYRAVPGQPGYEVFVDTTRDAFGARGWSYGTCPGTSTLALFGPCR